MKFCVWAGGSFEAWYSSYHLMLAILKEMLAAGHEVWLVQPMRSDGRMPRELAGEERLHAVNIKRPSTEKANFVKRYIEGFGYYAESAKAVRRLKVDAILLQSNNNAILPVRAARRMGVPIVYNVQDIFPQDALCAGKLTRGNPAYMLARRLQAAAYRGATRVVTISEDLKKTIREEGRQDVDVVYNWSYQNEPYDIPDERNHFLLSNEIKRGDGFRVIYAGNVGQMMDAEMIIQCAVRLREKKDIVFYVIGEGSNLKHLRERAGEEGLANVRFYGRQPMEYAQDNYCAADVNINPVPRGVMYTCMPSKTATCLLSQKATVVSMDEDSDMARRLRSVDLWSVVAPGDAEGMTRAILNVYEGGDWGRKSRNAAAFLERLAPIENAREYTRILEEAAKPC